MRGTVRESLVLRAAVASLGVAFAVAGSGCKNKSAPVPEASSARAPEAPASPSAANAHSLSCAKDARVLPYAPGLEKLGEQKLFKLRLVSANPAPPIKGVNSWIVEIVDAAGAAVSGAKLEAHRTGEQADPSMPDHGHGSPRSALITTNADGTFTVESLYFFMPGVWRTGLDVTAPDGRKDTVYFFFCVEG